MTTPRTIARYAELFQWFRTAMPGDQVRLHVTSVLKSPVWRLTRAAYEAAVITMAIEPGLTPLTFHAMLTRTNIPPSTIPEFDPTWLPRHLADRWTGLSDNTPPKLKTKRSNPTRANPHPSGKSS